MVLYNCPEYWLRHINEIINDTVSAKHFNIFSLQQDAQILFFSSFVFSSTTSINIISANINLECTKWLGHYFSWDWPLSLFKTKPECWNIISNIICNYSIFIILNTERNKIQNFQCKVWFSSLPHSCDGYIFCN